MKTIGLRLDSETFELLNRIAKRNLENIEEINGLDFSEASLLIRVSLGNLLLNPPPVDITNKIITSIKDNSTFHAFLLKIWKNR